jgi:predicted transcriptional regulator
MQTRGVQETVLDYIQSKVGLTVTARAISDDLNLDRRQVMNAAWSLAQDGLITKVKQGMYRFEGHSNGNPLYELIAKTASGDLVLQTEQGNAIVVRPL